MIWIRFYDFTVELKTYLSRLFAKALFSIISFKYFTKYWIMRIESSRLYEDYRIFSWLQSQSNWMIQSFI